MTKPGRPGQIITYATTASKEYTRYRYTEFRLNSSLNVSAAKQEGSNQHRQLQNRQTAYLESVNMLKDEEPHFC